MPTGTVPGAFEVKIQGPSASLTAIAIDGGFDPVQLTGAVGDTVQIYVLDAAHSVLMATKLGVPASAPPIVIRTQPPKKKTDVPLNGALLIYFSEPVDGATVTASSIQLLQGTTVVSGTTRFADSNHVSVEFVPNAPLAANTPYQLVVTSQVRDLDGQALPAPETIPFTTGTTTLGPTASVTLTADTISIRGLTYQMTVLVRDAAGNELPDRPVTWAVSDPGVFTVSATGLLTARAEGPGGVQATVDGISSGFKSVYVMGGDLVSVVVRPSPDTVIQGDQTFMGATLYDARGIVLQPRPITWSSSASGVASVAPQFPGGTVAIAMGIAPGTALITAAWEGPTTISGTATLVVTPPPPVATVTLSQHSATLLKDATLQLYATLRSATGYVIRTGATVVWSSDQPTVAMVDASGLVTAVGPGTAAVTATSQGKSDTAAVHVAVITLTAVQAGAYAACGVTTGGAGYCWGDNSYAELGNASYVPSRTPVPIQSALSFSAVSVGWNHTCGLSAGAAYCWGDNLYGEIGDGTFNDEGAPVAVSGGAFAVIGVGEWHTCGLTSGGSVLCWGLNAVGQLGDSSTVTRPVPGSIAGGRTFTDLSVGADHNCALATGGAAYCWGSNNFGQLGDSTTVRDSVPVAVRGGLVFSTLAAGAEHTCGIATGGALYCWGDNSYGQLGNPSPAAKLTPFAVAGGLSFASIAGGATHTCGLTAGGSAYCWGSNGSGELGDGTTTTRSAPVPVAGSLTFVSLSARGNSTCAFSTTGIAYCWGDNRYWELGTAAGILNSLVPIRVAGQP